MAKKFGLVEARRAVEFARARCREVTPDVAFGIEIGFASQGMPITVQEDAATEIAAQRDKASAARGKAANLQDRARAKAEAIRKAFMRFANATEKLVARVKQIAWRRAEAKLDDAALAARAQVRIAQAAEAEAKVAGEIADLF